MGNNSEITRLIILFNLKCGWIVIKDVNVCSRNPWIICLSYSKENNKIKKPKNVRIVNLDGLYNAKIIEIIIPIR